MAKRGSYNLQTESILHKWISNNCQALQQKLNSGKKKGVSQKTFPPATRINHFQGCHSEYQNVFFPAFSKTAAKGYFPEA